MGETLTKLLVRTGISAETRTKVYQRYYQKCAYCGRKPPRLQIDHRHPVSRSHTNDAPEDINHIGNLMPACPRCNRYKGAMRLEEFRKQIAKQVERARLRSWNFKMAEDYGLIIETNAPVVFYFETLREEDTTTYPPEEIQLLCHLCGNVQKDGICLLCESTK